MKLVKEIKSKSGVLHFRRYLLLDLVLFKIYIHHIFKSDEDVYLHNHPWNFISLTLIGRFIERVRNSYKERGPLSLNFKRYDSYHRIDKVINSPVKSIFITWGKNPKKWGYWVDNKHIDFDEFREIKKSKLI